MIFKKEKTKFSGDTAVSSWIAIIGAVLVCALLSGGNVWAGEYWVKSYDTIIDAQGLSMRNPKMAALQKKRIKGEQRAAKVYDVFPVRTWNGNKSAHKLNINQPPLDEVFLLMLVDDSIPRSYFNGDNTNKIINDNQAQKLFDDFKPEGATIYHNKEDEFQVAPKVKVPKKDKAVQ